MLKKPFTKPLSIIGLLSCCSFAAAYDDNHGQVWAGASSLRDPAQALPAKISFSFAPDGVGWSQDATTTTPSTPNSLNTALARGFINAADSTSGPKDIDYGREMIRQALSAWARDSGLSVVEQADPGTARSNTTPTPNIFGANPPDIRIGGYGSSGDYGAAGFPPQGGDLWFNTSAFHNARFGNSNERAAAVLARRQGAILRNLALHESGHSLGLLHPEVVSTPLVSRPFWIMTQHGNFSPSRAFSNPEDLSYIECGPVWDDFLNISVPHIDDLRQIHRNYGDRYARSLAQAGAPVDYGSLSGKEIYEPRLSLNGVSTGTNGHSDHFTFVAAGDFEITVEPIGEQYPRPSGTANSLQAGNLAMEVTITPVSGSPSVFVVDANSGGSGETFSSSLSVAGITTGDTVGIRVYDAGPNPSINQYVQLYDLTITDSMTVSPNPSPDAWAGADKRLAKHQRGYFVGNVYSRAYNTAITGYAWDFDDDGIADSTDAVAMHVFTTIGKHTVTLTVSDALGGTGSHQIDVSVYEPNKPVVYGALNDRLYDGASLPLVLQGEGLQNVTDVEVVYWDGDSFEVDTDFTVTGTISVDSNGLEITGLTIEGPSTCDSAAEGYGPRSLRVSTSTLSHVAVDAILFSRDPRDVNEDCEVTILDAMLVKAKDGDSCILCPDPCTNPTCPTCPIKGSGSQFGDPIQDCYHWCESCPDSIFDVTGDCIIDADDYNAVLDGIDD